MRADGTVYINADYSGFFAEIANQRGGYGLSRKAKRLVLAEANRTCVLHWHNHLIPHHFELSGRFKYQYKPRKHITVKIKKMLAAGQTVFFGGQKITDNVEKGGQVDLVRTGKAERQAEESAPIRATPQKAELTMRVPRYILYAQKNGRIRLAAEITSLTVTDKAVLTEVWKQAFYAALRNFGRSAFLRRRRL